MNPIIKTMFILLFLLCSCQNYPDQSIIKDGKRYGVTDVPFKGEWWHYYERGLSYGDGELWKDAESDLREALRRREEDQKKVRTYGRHWLNLPGRDSGYFPRRELGIVLFQQGRLSDAIRELEISYENETSTRAAVYLDRARKSLIEKKGTDEKAPEISILSPEAELISNASFVLIRGEVRDDTFVRHIRVGNQDIPIYVSEKTIPFSVKVPVIPGTNSISVIAEDLSGKTAEREITVRIDRIGPVISMENFSAGRGEIYFSADFFDNSGIRSISINGNETPCKGEKELSFEKRISVDPEDEFLNISVTDIAGNRTSGAYKRMEKTASYSNLIAENGKHLAMQIISQKRKQENTWLTLQADRTPPRLTFTYPNESRNIETFLDEILIQGQISDNREVRGLWFNREHIAFRGKNNRFSYIYPLKKGRNIILIRSSDAAGNETRKEIRIMKKEPSVRDYEARLRILVSSFSETPVPHTGFQDILDTVMFQRKRFRTVSLTEINTHPADCILEGSIRKRPAYIEVSADLYLNESRGKQRRIARVDTYREFGNSGEEPAADRETIEEMAREIYLKLADEVPLTEGKVIEKGDEKIIATDLGEESRIKAGMDLIVFQKNPDEPEKDFPNMGRARIRKIQKDRSYAGITKGDPQTIREGQYVITR